MLANVKGNVKAQRNAQVAWRNRLAIERERRGSLTCPKNQTTLSKTERTGAVRRKKSRRKDRHDGESGVQEGAINEVNQASKLI